MLGAYTRRLDLAHGGRGDPRVVLILGCHSLFILDTVVSGQITRGMYTRDSLIVRMLMSWLRGSQQCTKHQGHRKQGGHASHICHARSKHCECIYRDGPFRYPEANHRSAVRLPTIFSDVFIIVLINYLPANRMTAQEETDLHAARSYTRRILSSVHGLRMSRQADDFVHLFLFTVCDNGGSTWRDCRTWSGPG